MSQLVTSASHKRISIYDRLNRRFTLNERSRLRTHHHCSLLYNCHEPDTIEDIALDTTRRSSIYQRAYIKRAYESYGKYKFF